MIYILSNDHKETASMLDDKSLDKQIRDIAQVLMSLHVARKTEGYSQFNFTYKKSKWLDWITQCKANYLWLVGLAEACFDELDYRGLYLPQAKRSKKNKLILFDSWLWAIDNVPDLPESKKFNIYSGFDIANPIPLIMPKKYIKQCSAVTSPCSSHIIDWYRNFYEAKLLSKDKCYIKGYLCIYPHLKKNLTWTNREIPEWLK